MGLLVFRGFMDDIFSIYRQEVADHIEDVISSNKGSFDPWSVLGHASLNTVCVEKFILRVEYLYFFMCPGFAYCVQEAI